MEGDPRSTETLLERADLVTQDMDQIAGLIRQLYVEHSATFRCDDPARVDGQVRSATADGLSAGLLRYGGFEYVAGNSPVDAPMAVAATQGGGVIASGGEELSFSRGDVFMLPGDGSAAATMFDAGFAVLQVPWPAVRAVAEERAGLAAADLRFEAMAPVSPAYQVVWARTADFICGQLVASGVTAVSPLMAQEMSRLAAAVMLETFPNTTMTAAYVAGLDWVPPPAVRRAAAFIEAHADQPVTLHDIAAAAGVDSRVLPGAFRRYYATSPAGYLRRIRLERAHRELRDCDPAAGVTVAAVARRWGWPHPGQFTVAYQRRFGEPPGRTLRA